MTGIGLFMHRADRVTAAHGLARVPLPLRVDPGAARLARLCGRYR